METVIRIEKSDADLIDAVLEIEALEAERFDGVGIDGGGDIATIIASLGGASLTALVATLRARWARARFVKIEVDGIKVEGASPEQIEAILRRMLAEREKPGQLPPPHEPEA